MRVFTIAEFLRGWKSLIFLYIISHNTWQCTFALWLCLTAVAVAITIFPDNTFKTIKKHFSKTCNSCLTKQQKKYKPVQVSKAFKKPLNDITNGIINKENN